MQNEIQTLIQKCKVDYTKFATAGDRGTPDPDSYFGKTLANFENSFTIKEGKKYIKIINRYKCIENIYNFRFCFKILKKFRFIFIN